MRGLVALIAAGLVTATMGVVFHLQGQSVLGPESSFMYSSPEWVAYGVWMLVVGLAVACAGATAATVLTAASRRRQ